MVTCVLSITNRARQSGKVQISLDLTTGQRSIVSFPQVQATPGCESASMPRGGSESVRRSRALRGDLLGAWGFKVSAFVGKTISRGHSQTNVCGTFRNFRWNESCVSTWRVALQSEAPLSPSSKSASVNSGGFLVRRLNGSTCLQQARWKRLLLILALLPLLLALNSCGGGSSTPAAPTPTITASCAASSVAVNGTVQCTANILNLNSTLADWQAGGVAGGNSTFGTIDVNGLYTAPKAVPANNIVTITATVSVTILQPTKISSVVCLDPATKVSTLTVASSKSVACTALTSENVQVPVFWQVNGNTIPIPTTLGIGTMTAQGNYRAPLIPPAGGTITITAVSQVDSTQTMSVTVTDTFGNAVLQGSYAFSSSGRQTATNGFFSRAGSFVADGNGGLTGGLEDVNPRPSGITQEPITFSGSYSIGPDGRGTMQFCEPSNSNACISPTTQFRVVVISPQQAQIIDFQGGSTANGEIVLQPDISVFNTGSVIGTYTFSFSGFSSATSEESAVGEFAADGLPDKVTGLAKITSGELDINSGGVTTSQVAITS